MQKLIKWKHKNKSNCGGLNEVWLGCSPHAAMRSQDRPCQRLARAPRGEGPLWLSFILGPEGMTTLKKDLAIGKGISQRETVKHERLFCLEPETFFNRDFETFEFQEVKR